MSKSKTTKKKPVINRDKFIESVYHIVFYGNVVRNLENVFISVSDKINPYEKMVIRHSIQSYVLLTVVCLSDEINNYLFKFTSTDKDINERVAAYRDIIEPILEEINKWGDIRRFRNNVLAHNFRIDSADFKSVHLSNEIFNYNIPLSIMDLATLFKYIDGLTKVAKELFILEYNEAQKTVDSFGNKPKKNTQTAEQETNKLNLIFAEVNERIAKYKKNMSYIVVDVESDGPIPYKYDHNPVNDTLAMQ